MTRDSYRKAFRDLKADILRLLKERQEYEQKLRDTDSELRKLSDSVRVIGTLSRADAEEIEAWSNFDPSSQPGLTDAVLWALFVWKNDEPITAKEIRDTIIGKKIGELDKYKNPLASIYTVLGRLIENEDADELTRGDDKRAFAITPKGVERITSRVSPIFAAQLDRITNTVVADHKVRRAQPPRGSLAEKFFAEDDAKMARGFTPLQSVETFTPSRSTDERKKK